MREERLAEILMMGWAEVVIEVVVGVGMILSLGLRRMDARV